MFRVIVAALLGLLVLAAGAAAAPPDANRLRAIGVKVAWPATGTLQPGQALEVRVTSKRVRSRVVLVRVDARGRVMRVLARRTLRSGTFKATLPATPGARYRLQLAAGKLRYSSAIATAAPAPIPAAAPAPPAPAPAGDPCDGAPPTYEATRAATPSSGRPGDFVTFTITNHGPGCVWIPHTHWPSWQRATADGGWEHVPVDPCTSTVVAPDAPPTCAGLPAFWPLEPGGIHVYQHRIPTGLTPGRHRIDGHEIEVLS